MERILFQQSQDFIKLNQGDTLLLYTDGLTEAINPSVKQYGEEIIATGKPMVYTSADSVFQIAAHEDYISVERLYEICRK